MLSYLKRTHWIIAILIMLAILFMQPTAVAFAQDVTPTPVPPTEIPEPITIILFGIGLAGLSAASALGRSKSE